MPFKPGVSGNPGGRPKAAFDAQALARQHTPAAIAALVKALANERERVPAAVALLDRAWGKPIAPQEHSGSILMGLEAIDRPPAESREQWIERRQRELAAQRLTLATPVGSAD